MYFREKIMVQKGWDCLTLGRFMKLKNMPKHRFLFSRVKTKIKKILWKIPKNSVKHVNDLR
jgi:hypothetical protein